MGEKKKSCTTIIERKKIIYIIFYFTYENNDKDYTNNEIINLILINAAKSEGSLI